MQSRVIEAGQFLAMVRRQIRAAGKRVASGEVEDFAELVALHQVVDAAIVEALAGGLRANYSWQMIADATGTTKEAAVQKWASKVRSVRVEVGASS